MQRTEISAEERAEIIRDFVGGMRKDVIAAKYNVPRDYVCAVCAGEKRVIICKQCGRKFFIPSSEKLRKFCSLECRSKYFHIKERERRANLEPEGKPVSKSSLDDKIRAADAMGISYGQYVALQRLKEAKR